MRDALLHLMFSATDAVTPPDTTNYGALALSGIVTIVVAIISVFAAKAAGNRSEHPSEAPTPPDEPAYVVLMRKELTAERRALAKSWEEISRLNRVLLIHDIDPDTGKKLET